jgi:putative transposase
VEDVCRKILCGLAEEYRFRILAMEIMPDHVHLLIDAKPQLYIPDTVKILKGNTARWLFMDHPALKEKLWGGHLWNPSYCVVTVSDRSWDQVMKYIASQKEKAWNGRGRPPGSGKRRQS